MFPSRSQLPRAQRRGTTTVEFALTAPILFLLLMGSIEFSRANMLNHSAVVAATEGARRGIIPGATSEECKQVAERELSVVGFRSADVVVTPTVILNNTTQVTVDITVPMSSANGFVLPKFLAGAEIRKSVTLQREAAIESPETETGPGNNNS